MRRVVLLVEAEQETHVIAVLDLRRKRVTRR